MTCKFPTCQRHAEKNGYCVGHSIYAPGATSHVSKPVEKKSNPRPPIKNKSTKLGKAEREYKKIVVRKLAENPLCEMTTPACTRIAEGLHHMKGRGANLLDEKYLLRSCNACNLYVELHPLWAIEKGLSISKHIKAK